MAVTGLALKLAVVVLVICVINTAAVSQHAHQHPAFPSRTLVDGAQHPELIPDGEAYRAFFATVAKNPKMFLNPVGLNKEDVQAASGIIVSYQTAFKQLLQAYGYDAKIFCSAPR